MSCKTRYYYFESGLFPWLPLPLLIRPCMLAVYSLPRRQFFFCLSRNPPQTLKQMSKTTTINHAYSKLAFLPLFAVRISWLLFFDILNPPQVGVGMRDKTQRMSTPQCGVRRLVERGTSLSSLFFPK